MTSSLHVLLGLLPFVIAVAYPCWKVFQGAPWKGMFCLGWWLLYVSNALFIVVLPALVRLSFGEDRGNALANLLPDAQWFVIMFFGGWFFSGASILVAAGVGRWRKHHPLAEEPPPLPRSRRSWRNVLMKVLVPPTAAFLTLVLILVCCFVGTTYSLPLPPPPSTATHVYFLDWSAWQSWDYEYRFDAPPDVCEQFARRLMNDQSQMSGEHSIKASEFTQFPFSDSHFPPWFDVTAIRHGTLLTGDTSYAVIDRDRNRLYYYNGN